MLGHPTLGIPEGFMRKALGLVSASLLFAGPALAADLGVKVPVYKAPPPPPVLGWGGWYAGVNAGWIQSGDGVSTASDPTSDATFGLVPGVTEGLAAFSTGAVPLTRRDGFIGGGQIGYNWQFGGFVTGFETDIQGLSGLQSSGSVSTAAVLLNIPVNSLQSAGTDTKFLGTVRGRVGFLATPAFLVYGTGGLAYGGVSGNVALAQSATNGFIGAGAASFSDARVGWTAGVGAEWMFAPNWSLKGEYLHYDLGTAHLGWQATGTLPGDALFNGAVYQSNTSSFRFDGDFVRAGVNYHF
jgi:outer membrane immunogenic protein